MSEAAAAAPTAIAPTNGASAPTSAPATGAAPSPPTGVPAAGGAPAAAAAPPAGPSVRWKVADIQAAIQAAGEGATEADVFALLKGYKHRVKIDGQETEVPFDEMLRSAGLSRKARQEITKVRETEQKLGAARKELENIAARMLDPRQAEPILEKNWGGPEAVYKWAKEKVARYEQYMALPEAERQRIDRMTQAQRESVARERQLAERENRIKAAEQKQAKAARDAWVAKVGRESGPAFQALGLPQEPKLVAEAHRRTVATLDKAHRDRIPMTLREAQREAVDSLMASARALFTGLKPDVLRGLVGEEGLSAVQQANLARVEGQPGRTTPGEQPQIRGEDGKFKRDLRVSRLGKLDEI